jgi:hypothetical protein
MDDGWGEHVEPDVISRGKYVGLLLPGTEPEVLLSPTPEQLTRCTTHVIHVAARLTPEIASDVIWHELAHVAQAERDPHGAFAKYTAERDRCIAEQGSATLLQAIRRNPYEREALVVEHERRSTRTLAGSNRRCSMPPRADHPLITAVADGEIVLSRRYRESMADRERARRDAVARAPARMP